MARPSYRKRTTTEIECTKCHRMLPWALYAKNWPSGWPVSWCPRCRRDYTRRYRERLKKEGKL